MQEQLPQLLEHQQKIEEADAALQRSAVQAAPPMVLAAAPPTGDVVTDPDYIIRRGDSAKQAYPSTAQLAGLSGASSPTRQRRGAGT